MIFLELNHQKEILFFPLTNINNELNQARDEVENEDEKITKNYFFKKK